MNIWHSGPNCIRDVTFNPMDLRYQAMTDYGSTILRILHSQ